MAMKRFFSCIKNDPIKNATFSASVVFGGIHFEQEFVERNGL